MWHLLSLVFLVVASATVAEADSYDEAEFACDRGNYTRAARLFRPLAEQGIASAQFKLGLRHSKTWGVPQNYRTALR